MPYKIYTNHFIREYEAKYNNKKNCLLHYTIKQVEDFDKKFGSYKFKGEKFNLTHKNLLLDYHKWWLIDGVYYQIPDSFGATWFKTLFKKYPQFK